MNAQKAAPLTHRPEPSHSIPRHPFFELAEDQASFSQCMDAIDSVNAVIELCNFLKLDSDIEGGLTPKAAYGFYWISVLTRGTLSYVSDRLIALNKQQKEQHQAKAECLSALLAALPGLDEVNSECFLGSAAAQMGIGRDGLDRFIHIKTN